MSILFGASKNDFRYLHTLLRRWREGLYRTQMQYGAFMSSVVNKVDSGLAPQPCHTNGVKNGTSDYLARHSALWHA